MKLAVITDEIDEDLDRATDVMLEYGVLGVELRTIWDKNIVDAPFEYWQRAKDIITSKGMSVVSIASPFYKCDLPGDAAGETAGPLHSAVARGLSEQMKVLDLAIKAAQFFDTKLIRVFTFWRRQRLTPQIEETIIDSFSEPIEIAKQADVILGLENEHACYIGTGAQAARVLEKINSPYLRGIWDPGNAFCDGEQPFPLGYEAMKNFIIHVHVKDAYINSDTNEPVWSIVGEGQIKWAEQIKTLKESGYNGYLSLETHYNGQATKELSSRVCIESLKKLTEIA